MDLLQRINECDEIEIDSIIKEEIEKAQSNAFQVDKLGFLDYSKSNNIFKGFIPLNTRIKYSNFNMEDYSMNTTDFIYEFAHFIKEHKIKSKSSLVHNLESFINNYFGYAGKIKREVIFNDIAWQTTTTDEEYFEALKNNKISDLKGKGAAECTERSALAQQILSVFGFESYYCMGCVQINGRQEAHCFNVVKRKNDYALLDYSMPIKSFTNGNLSAYYPFIGLLTNDEFLDFINNHTIKSFEEYYIDNKNKLKLDKERLYVSGKYEIMEENIEHNIMR